jgi:hypothetical protein
MDRLDELVAVRIQSLTCDGVKTEIILSEDQAKLAEAREIPLARLAELAAAERMIGKTVYRITTPYRGVPKVTPYLVKNYRTTSKKHKIMFEVCAVGVGVMNVMSLKQFYLTREAAEAALSAGKGAM